MHKMHGELQENSDTFLKRHAVRHNLRDEHLKMVKIQDEFRKSLDMSKQFEYNIA